MSYLTVDEFVEKEIFVDNQAELLPLECTLFYLLVRTFKEKLLLIKQLSDFKLIKNQIRDFLSTGITLIVVDIMIKLELDLF